MATGTSEFIDVTTADKFLPEIWSQLLVVARENALIYAPLVDRRYEQGLTFGDTIHARTVGNLVARDKTANDAILYETITEIHKDITIATNNYAAIAVESIMKVQTDRDQLKMYSGKLGYALGYAVDVALAGLIDDASQTVGSMATENTDDELLRARQYLDDADAPQEKRYMSVSPAAETGLLKLDRFVHSDYELIHGTGAKVTSQERAYITSFMGIPIYKSVLVEGTNGAGHDNGMWQEQGMALVMQMKPKIYQQFDIDYLVDKVAVEQLYGTAEMRDDHIVWVKGA